MHWSINDVWYWIKTMWCCDYLFFFLFLCTSRWLSGGTQRMTTLLWGQLSPSGYSIKYSQPYLCIIHLVNIPRKWLGEKRGECFEFEDRNSVFSRNPGHFKQSKVTLEAVLLLCNNSTESMMQVILYVSVRGRTGQLILYKRPNLTVLMALHWRLLLMFVTACIWRL